MPDMNDSPAPGAPLWNDEQLARWSEVVVVGRFGIDAVYKLLQQIRDDERAAAAQREEALREELAEAMRECIDFTKSYGIGDEDGYKARYAELTGKDYDDDN